MTPGEASQIEGNMDKSRSIISRRMRRGERATLASPGGDECEVEVRKDAKGRPYLVVFSLPENPFRLTSAGQSG